MAKADTSVRFWYAGFERTLRAGRFFQPAEDCAEFYFQKLSETESVAALHPALRRNYAAALQDDAQQAMNIWLKADVQQLECIGSTLKFDPIPRQLQRAAELLGEGHYMYRPLQARKLLFEGILLQHWGLDEAGGRACLSLFEQSLALEPQSPIPWHRMSLVYAINLRQPDSSFICAHQARGLVPNWVLPFADLGYAFLQLRKSELANQALKEAVAIDSLHPYVINRWAIWLKVLGGKANLEKAVVLFEKYQKGRGMLYPCWLSDYGEVLTDLGRYSESEAKYREAISLDSTNASPWNNLGNMYRKTRRYAEAEQVLKKAIALDSTEIGSWNYLGLTYINTRRYAEAEPVLKKVIELDSTNVYAWNNLGVAYTNTRRYAEAEAALTKAIALDSTFANARKHLGMVCFKTNRPEEARQNFLQAKALNPNYAPTLLGMAYLLAAEGKTEEALGYVEQAIGKGSTFEQLESDEDLAPLRALPEWKGVMKKHFPDKVKD